MLNFLKEPEVPMELGIIITTTPTIEGWRVTEYIDVIAVAVVKGTGPVAEWFNKATDMFGGRSGTFEDKLDACIEEGMVMLDKKAGGHPLRNGRKLAVIGMDVDIVTFERNQIGIVLGGTLVAIEPAPAEARPPASASRNMHGQTKEHSLDQAMGSQTEEIVRNTTTLPELRPLGERHESLPISSEGLSSEIPDIEPVKPAPLSISDSDRHRGVRGRKRKRPAVDRNEPRRNDGTREDHDLNSGSGAAGIRVGGSKRRSLRTPEELLKKAAKANERVVKEHSLAAKQKKKRQHEKPKPEHQRQKSKQSKEKKKPPSMIDDSFEVREGEAGIAVMSPTEVARPQTDLDVPQ